MGKKLILVILIFLSAACSNVDKELISKTENRINGETITLSGFEENNLLKKNISNLKLYSFDNGKNKVYYKENLDYVVVGNRIKRIKDSKIPDFAFHKVVLNDDLSFTFAASPRNPELTIEYQVFCDYDYTDMESLQGYYKSSFLSSEIKDRLKNKKAIKIAVIGTSISAGAHTWAQYYEESDRETYPYLVATAIENKFGSQVTINNYSMGGSSLSYLEESYESIIAENYDLIFIEFGMNDHLYSLWLEQLPNFESVMSSIVKTSRQKDVNIILVGFFQQNLSWDLEFMGSTNAYNKSLFDIARQYNYYFADINKEFSKYDANKINRDLCGDYLHHPTTFGHQLYYKTIMPVFFEDSVSDGTLYKLVN